MNLIVNVSENWAIGKGNSLLFHLGQSEKTYSHHQTYYNQTKIVLCHSIGLYAKTVPSSFFIDDAKIVTFYQNKILIIAI